MIYRLQIYEYSQQMDDIVEKEISCDVTLKIIDMILLNETSLNKASVSVINFTFRDNFLTSSFSAFLGTKKNPASKKITRLGAISDNQSWTDVINLASNFKWKLESSTKFSIDFTHAAAKVSSNFQSKHEELAFLASTLRVSEVAEKHEISSFTAVAARCDAIYVLNCKLWQTKKETNMTRHR